MNKEEQLVGGVFILSFWYFLGWWILPLILICGKLWAMGGAIGYSKLWRRLGVPLIFCSVLSAKFNSNIILLSIIPLWRVLTMGYGIPDGQDKGSFLGRFFYKLSGENEVKTEILTRFTIAVLLGVSLLPLAFINLPMWYLSLLTLAILKTLIVACVN